LVGTGSLEAAFGRDHQIAWIWIQRFRDQRLADVRTVRIRRVYERNAEPDCSMQCGKRRTAIGRRSPDPGPCHAHRAETKSMQRQIAAEDKCAASSSIDRAQGRHRNKETAVNKGILTFC